MLVPVNMWKTINYKKKYSGEYQTLEQIPDIRDQYFSSTGIENHSCFDSSWARVIQIN